MIGKLKGRIDSQTEDSAIIDVNGVGYEVFCASRTLAALPSGSPAELIIETHVREDHIHLYGFLDAAEREWFRLLLTVQGVGVRMALALLSAFAPEQLAQAIAAQDSTSLTKVSGVGPKLATRLITELKNKVAKMPSGSVVLPLPAKGKKTSGGGILATVSDDAVSALVNLGYGRSEAFAAVANAFRQQGDAAKLDDLIRHGLKELAR